MLKRWRIPAGKLQGRAFKVTVTSQKTDSRNEGVRGEGIVEPEALKKHNDKSNTEEEEDSQNTEIKLGQKTKKKIYEESPL